MPTIPEYLSALSVTDTLKGGSLPAAATKLPWSEDTGSWGSGTGWSAGLHSEAWLGAKAGSRSGFYWNTANLKGGNAACVLQWAGLSGNLINLRQFAIWLFSAAGASPSGYQLVAWQTGTPSQFTFKLRKWIGGEESPLGETVAVGMEIGGYLALVALAGKVSAWVRATEGSSWALVGSEVADTALTEGFSGVDGNGTNARVGNFATATLATASAAPKPGTRVLAGVGR